MKLLLKISKFSTNKWTNKFGTNSSSMYVIMWMLTWKFTLRSSALKKKKKKKRKKYVKEYHNVVLSHSKYKRYIKANTYTYFVTKETSSSLFRFQQLLTLKTIFAVQCYWILPFTYTILKRVVPILTCVFSILNWLILTLRHILHNFTSR